MLGALTDENSPIPDMVASNGIDSAYLVGEKLHELRGGLVLLNKPLGKTRILREAISSRGGSSSSFSIYTTKTPLGIAQGINKVNELDEAYNIHLLPLIYAKSEEDLDRATNGMYLFMDRAILFSDEVQEHLGELEARIGKERSRFGANFLPDKTMSKNINSICNGLYRSIREQSGSERIQPIYARQLEEAA